MFVIKSKDTSALSTLTYDLSEIHPLISNLHKTHSYRAWPMHCVLVTYDLRISIRSIRSIVLGIPKTIMRIVPFCAHDCVHKTYTKRVRCIWGAYCAYRLRMKKMSMRISYGISVRRSVTAPEHLATLSISWKYARNTLAFVGSAFGKSWVRTSRKIVLRRACADQTQWTQCICFSYAPYTSHMRQNNPP